MSDLIIDVRQISSYPPIASSNGTETILLQQGGLGGPYASISAEALVSTALNSASLGVGTPVPANASPGNVFANPVVLPLPQASILWNAYDANGLKYVAAGMMAALNFDQAKGFDFVLAPVGNPNAAVIGDQSILQLTNAGNLQLPFGTLAVARDPASPNEVATLNYVGNHTVHSFNNRNGQVILNADDVYSALKLCDPIATQPWVQNAINQSIQNLLVTCPFVNRWNNRTGSVYLMLSDITTVFFQPGQTPMAPLFQLYGAPDPTITPLPDSPLRIFGAYQHGIITDPNASFASGALIETQPGRHIVWSDGVGEANIIASGDAAGNISLLINAGGTGVVYAQGLITLNQTRIQAGQSADGNVILLNPTVLGGQPQLAFEGQDAIVTGEIWNKGGGPIIFINQSGVRWATAPTDPADLTNKAYVDAQLATLRAQLQGPTP